MTLIETNVSNQQWDHDLARLNGHPWQSALWGDARREVEGIIDHRWAVRRDTDIVQMVRLYERRIPGFGKIAWMPRGPVSAPGAPSPEELEPEVHQCLKQQGFMLAVANPWRRREEGSHSDPDKAPKTIWMDLTLGREKLWQNLDRQVRYSVGHARRLGVVIESTSNPARIVDFYNLCRLVSSAKMFALRTSPPLMLAILDHGNADAEGRLFVGTCDGRVVAGNFIFRCGRTVHSFWSASDRAFSKLRAAEAVRWATVEWALDQGCTCYDLGGIDPRGNPGTYTFKKKMGGFEVDLVSRRVHPLTTKGQMMAPVLGRALNSRLASLPFLARSFWPRPERALG